MELTKQASQGWGQERKLLKRFYSDKILSEHTDYLNTPTALLYFMDSPMPAIAKTMILCATA